MRSGEQRLVSIFPILKASSEYTFCGYSSSSSFSRPTFSLRNDCHEFPSSSYLLLDHNTYEGNGISMALFSIQSTPLIRLSIWASLILTHVRLVGFAVSCMYRYTAYLTYQHRVSFCDSSYSEEHLFSCRVLRQVPYCFTLDKSFSCACLIWHRYSLNVLQVIIPALPIDRAPTAIKTFFLKSYWLFVIYW